VKNVEGSTRYLMKYPPINKEPSECPYTPKYGAIEVIDWLKKKLCRAAWKMYIYDKNLRVYRSKKPEGAYEIITYEKDRKIGETVIQIQDIPESVYSFIEEFTRPAREEELKLREMIKNDPIYRDLQWDNT